MTRRRTLFRLAVVAVVAVTVAVAGYAGYAFVSGSAEYLAGTPEHIGCDTPLHRFGWAYETINYDIADDEALLVASPDPNNCTKPTSTAGGEVVSSDGVHIAGWYIPAEGSIGAEGPTIVIVHGGRTNKSGVLDYAPAFHEDYNLLLPDLRNSGRSGGTESTSGLREQLDLRAMLDWLERTKHPTWIAVMGNSNGAATALAEGLGDERVRRSSSIRCTPRSLGRWRMSSRRSGTCRPGPPHGHSSRARASGSARTSRPSTRCAPSPPGTIARSS